MASSLFTGLLLTPDDKQRILQQIQTFKVQYVPYDTIKSLGSANLWTGNVLQAASATRPYKEFRDALEAISSPNTVTNDNLNALVSALERWKKFESATTDVYKEAIRGLKQVFDDEAVQIGLRTPAPTPQPSRPLSPAPSAPVSPGGFQEASIGLSPTVLEEFGRVLPQPETEEQIELTSAPVTTSAAAAAPQQRKKGVTGGSLKEDKPLHGQYYFNRENLSQFPQALRSFFPPTYDQQPDQTELVDCYTVVRYLNQRFEALLGNEAFRAEVSSTELQLKKAILDTQTAKTVSFYQQLFGKLGQFYNKYGPLNFVSMILNFCLTMLDFAVGRWQARSFKPSVPNARDEVEKAKRKSGEIMREDFYDSLCSATSMRSLYQFVQDSPSPVQSESIDDFLKDKANAIQIIDAFLFSLNKSVTTAFRNSTNAGSYFDAFFSRFFDDHRFIENKEADELLNSRALLYFMNNPAFLQIPRLPGAGPLEKVANTTSIPLPSGQTIQYPNFSLNRFVRAMAKKLLENNPTSLDEESQELPLVTFGAPRGEPIQAPVQVPSQRAQQVEQLQKRIADLEQQQAQLEAIVSAQQQQQQRQIGGRSVISFRSVPPSPVPRSPLYFGTPAPTTVIGAPRAGALSGVGGVSLEASSEEGPQGLVSEADVLESPFFALSD